MSQSGSLINKGGWMRVVWIVLALVTYAIEIYLVHRYGQRVDLTFLGKVVKIPTFVPGAKLLIEPLLWMVLGLALVVFGVLGTSPIWLLIIGQPVWALVAFLVLVAVSTQTKIKYNGPRPTFDILPFRMALGLVFCMIGGAFLAIAGAIISAPVLFTILSLF
jgi:hypothetical protein